MLSRVDSSMGFNPEIIKHIEDIEATLLQISLTIKDLNSIPSPVKDGLDSTLKRVNDSLQLIKLQYSSPLESDGTFEKIGLGALPDIHLEEFHLIPANKEVIIGGESTRIAPAEFKVLYGLASHCGQPFNLGSSHSLLTRLSNLRRQFPILKSRIESLGGGTYVLNCKVKK
jgi:hypothetical protein